MWDIYVLGDLKFLASVFNAVAMILSGNLLITAVKIFFLLAVLQLALLAIFRQQGVAWSQLIITWLAFSICFLPKVSVALHDRASLKSISVANVPLGIAVFGSISSNLGKVVTDSLQAVMHSTNGQQYQVASSFNELLRLRSQLLSKGFLNQEQQQNWQNYHKDCLEVGLKLAAPQERSLNFSHLFETSLPQALRFNSQVYFTQVRSNGKTESLSCEQAYQHLSNNLSQSIRNYLSGRATDKLGSAGSNNSLSSNISGLFNGNVVNANSPSYNFGSGAFNSTANSSPYGTGLAGNFIDFNVLNQEIKAISRGQLAAQDYMLAVALAGIILESPEYSQLGQVIAQQNLTQLYSQWSLQGDLFFKTVKPVLTFLEGFFYAVSPVVMLLMLLNSYGLNLLGKYALFLIWLQMWQPIIVIINLYYQHAIELQLSLLQQQTIALDSFIGITRLQQELESYVATSGMLLSAVGTLALFLLYGGAITATSLASKLTPVTASATQSLSPDLTASAPVLSTSSRYQNDNLLGSRMVGSEGMIGSINLGSSLQSVLSASQTALKQTGASVMQAIAHSETGSYLASLSNEQRANLAQQVSRSTGFDTGEVKSFLNTTARNSLLAHEQNWSQVQSNNTLAEAGVATGINSGSLGSVGMNLRQHETSLKSRQSNQSHSQGLQDREGFQINSSKDAKLVDSVVKALQEMSSSGSTATQQHNHASTDTDTVMSSLSSLEQVASQNSFLQARSASISATQNYSPLALANMVNSSPAQQAFLQKMIDSSPSLQASSIAQQQLLQAWTPDREQARTAASLMAIFSDQSQQGLQRQQAVVSQLMFMGLGSNYQTPETEINNLTAKQGSLTAQVNQSRQSGQEILNHNQTLIQQGAEGISQNYKLKQNPNHAREVVSPKIGKVKLPTSVDEGN